MSIVREVIISTVRFRQSITSGKQLEGTEARGFFASPINMLNDKLLNLLDRYIETVKP